MLKIENLPLPPGAGREALARAAAKALRVPPEAIRELEILRRRVDARDGVAMVYTLAVTVEQEAAVLRRCRSRKVSRWKPEPDYRPPGPRPPADVRPVVAGAGPAGLFAALVLALPDDFAELTGESPVVVRFRLDLHLIANGEEAHHDPSFM